MPLHPTSTDIYLLPPSAYYRLHTRHNLQQPNSLLFLPYLNSPLQDSGLADYILHWSRARRKNTIPVIMSDLQGRKVFKVFNQDFIVDERYTVTKELGQGAYGIVWYDVTSRLQAAHAHGRRAFVGYPADVSACPQCRYQFPDQRRSCYQKGDQCLQQEDLGQACAARDKVVTTFQRAS